MVWEAAEAGEVERSKVGRGMAESGAALGLEGCAGSLLLWPCTEAELWQQDWVETSKPLPLALLCPGQAINLNVYQSSPARLLGTRASHLGHPAWFLPSPCCCFECGPHGPARSITPSTATHWHHAGTGSRLTPAAEGWSA